jgi:hypothetical protein
MLHELEENQSALETKLGELDFHPGEQRCKILRRRPWPGKLLEQPDLQDEVREWFRKSLLDFHKAFGVVAGSLAPASSR